MVPQCYQVGRCVELVEPCRTLSLQTLSLLLLAMSWGTFAAIILVINLKKLNMCDVNKRNEWTDHDIAMMNIIYKVEKI